MRIRSLVLSFTALTGCPGSLSDPQRFADYDAGASQEPAFDAAPFDAPIVESSVDASPEAAPQGPCPDVPTAVFAQLCGSACHAAVIATANLDLQSPDIAGRLLNKPANGNPSLLLIHPTAPNNSVLYTKLTASPPFGSRMPASNTPLDDFTIGCVLAWVSSVADGGVPDAAQDAATD